MPRADENLVMFCVKCGTNVNPEMRFCPKCGAEQGAAAAGSASASPSAGPQKYQYKVESRPSYSYAQVQLEAGQSIRAESGAMVAMSPSIKLTSKMEGGIMGALKRIVTRESLFQSTFTAHGAPGEVLLAPPLPGDVEGIELANQSYMVQASSFLAGEPSMVVETKFGGMKSLFSGEGVFFIQIRGTGLALVSSFGAIVKKTLAANEKYIVDTGHIVAFEETIQYTLRKASEQGWLRSMVSGEGVVAEYTGPGTIYLQTRNLQAFTGQLIPLLPTQNSGGLGFRLGG